ncbi:MAG: PilN domain-containing protein [Deltaproteobacteria bacterium]|nr:PilN domain-containing protein [Deltaproteobacteria bacterium]
MIRINLLPFRAARKRENIRRQISIYVLVVILTLVVIGWQFWTINRQLFEVQQEKSNAVHELESYKKTLEEIKILEGKIKEIKTKLGVISDLEKGKAGPVLLLDAIATAVPKDKLWLTELKETKGTLSLSGTAMDNETVALFMDNLKQSEQIATVELQGTTLKELAQYRLKVTDFSLECTTVSLKQPEEDKKKK